MKQLVAGFLVCLVTVASATIDDRDMLGTFAVDCKNLAKGAVIVSMVDASLVAGDKITPTTGLQDGPLSYFGKIEPKSYIGVAEFTVGQQGGGYLEYYKDKRGPWLKTEGSNAMLLAAGLVFNAGQNTFRKCPIK
jgi:hypothetical protein